MPRAEKVHNVVPELQKLLVPIGSLEPHPDNARQGDVDFLKGTLREFGQYQIIVADSEGVIVVGRHRWEAMREEGWTHCAAVLRPIDPAEARRLRIADNAASDRAGYDQAKLLAELQAVTQEALDRAGAAAEDAEGQSAAAEALESVGHSQATLEGLEQAVNGRGRGEPATPPDDFDDPEKGMKTDFRCPNCEYEWSGQAKPTEAAA